VDRRGKGAKGMSRTSSRVRAIALALGASAASSLSLGAVYVSGGNPQLEGVLLGIALGGMSVTLVLWAKYLMPEGGQEQVRETLATQDDRADVAAAFDAGAESIERRSFLAKAFAAAVAAFGVAALFPIRSLGERPGRALFHTAWKRGARLMTRDGRLIHREDLHVDGVLTVFPESNVTADSQALLIRLPSGIAPPGPANWAPDGLVAFSKICTHAGCPVGLYQAETKELFCPCHQSLFAVLERAKPVQGPATRRLPQLPLGIDKEGYVIALGDFDSPVGPGFWDRGRDREA